MKIWHVTIREQIFKGIRDYDTARERVRALLQDGLWYLELTSEDVPDPKPPAPPPPPPPPPPKEEEKPKAKPRPRAAREAPPHEDGQLREKNPDGYPCPSPTCPKTFAYRSWLERHLKSKPTHRQ